MKYLKRLLYLLYYLRETDYRQLRRFAAYASEITGKSRFAIISDALLSVFRYNTSLKDYFCFRYFKLTSGERRRWAGTGYMYEFQQVMNPVGAREVLADKIKFLNKYADLISRDFCSLSDLKKDAGLTVKLLSDSSGLVVLKNSRGQVGAEVEVARCDLFSPESLIRHMEKNGYDLAEQYVIQHPALMSLSASGLNTVRVFTQIADNGVVLLGARLRISVNSPVDNMAAGNLAAPVDISTGVVNGPGVYSDITRKEEHYHPVTGLPIVGFAIPFWPSILKLIDVAALRMPENRSVGWDIAITENGPELIEGNHNWCKLLWQLPVGKGLKSEIDKYL